MKPLGKKGKASSGGGMNSMLQQAQQMQQSILDIHEKLAEQEVEGTAGGGAVTVKMTGKHAVTAVKVSEDAIDPDDVEMLEDLLVAAFNDALDKANELASSQMNSVTGGLNIPGLDSIF